MVYRGVILGPRRHVDNREFCRVHQPADPGGRADSGRQFQHQPGCYRGPGAGGGGCGIHGGGGPGGHDRTLPLTAQSVVDGRPHMGHAPGRPVGALPDRLHPGHIYLSVPERSGPGRKAQHEPLPGLEVPLQIRA